MSWDALAWAKNTRVGRASDKLILIALADRHNEDCDRAFPSIAWLCDFSDLNRKTVIAALDRLEANGFIEDSGERVGRTQQIKSYKLHWETGPKVERFQKRNSSEITPKQSQKRDTEPVRNLSSEAKASSLWQALPADWVPTRPLSASLQTAVEFWPPGALQSELESFRSWALNAEPKKGKGLKKDWDDAFGNWLRRANRDTYSRQRMERPRTNPLVDLYRSTIPASAHPANCDGVGPALPAIGNR
jgi:hypothetical protein